MIHHLQLPTLEALPHVAEQLLDLLAPYPVVVLQGELGAGKTTLVHQLCRNSGVDEDVINSPTFAIVNVYTAHGDTTLYHMDCYRLNSLSEADNIGLVEYIRSGHRTYIEWPEIIAPILPQDTAVIQIQVLPSGQRSIRVDLPD